MKLESLTLNNFKGLRHLSFTTEGKNVEVHGDNATGKTTLFDAITWLMYGRDSLDRANFGVKTLDDNGCVIPDIDHSVEAVFSHSEHGDIKLRRVYREVWKKKRGTNTQELSHTTDYYIDDIPKSEKEYTAFIDQTINKDVFKMLTNPLFFNEKMGYKERRDILVGLIREYTDEAVIGDNNEFKPLLDVLAKHSLDDYMKGQKESKKKISKRLDEIPSRIDELESTKQEVELTEKEVDKEIKHINSLSMSAKNALEDAYKTPEIDKLYEKKKCLSGTLLQVQNDAEARQRDNIESQQKAIEKLSSRKMDIKKKSMQLDNTLEELDYKISVASKEREALLAEFEKEKKVAFVAPERGICELCGQPLPELSEADIASLKEKFLSKKAARKAEIREKGFKLKANLEEWQEQREQAVKDLKYNAEALADTEQLLQEAYTILDDIKRVTVNNSPEVQKLLSEIELVEHEIVEATTQKDSETESEKEIVEDISSTLQALMQQKAIIEQNKQLSAKIKEYREEQKMLTGQYEVLEANEFLCERYTKYKMEFLEEKINSRFQYAKFKLFKMLINGGVEACCEVTYNGIPYTDLNNAARINIGLDIINTLSNIYDVSIPVFIDNAESVTSFIACNSQTVKLFVDKNSDKLDVKLV